MSWATVGRFIANGYTLAAGTLFSVKRAVEAVAHADATVRVILRTGSQANVLVTAPSRATGSSANAGSIRTLLFP